MTRITVDSNMQSQFGVASDVVEVCDENGDILGYFRPRDKGPGVSLKELSPFSDEEIRELCKQPKTGRPLKEIWKDIEKRA